MRVLQAFGGLVLVLLGLLLLLVTMGLIQLTLLDLMGMVLALSGLLFWIPGIAFRKPAPWLTALFIPGSLAFAIGGILVYTARAGYGAWIFLWTILVIALGIAFWSMYSLGPRVRWLKFVGTIIAGVGALLFALFVTAFSNDLAARIVGPGVLVGMGLVYALGALAPRR